MRKVKDTIKLEDFVILVLSVTNNPVLRFYIRGVFRMVYLFSPLSSLALRYYD